MKTASVKRWALPLLLGVAACGTPSRELVTSAVVPAAVGKVSASVGDNQNTTLEVEVKHLAPPGRVASGARVYVVWVRPSGEGAIQNVGALRLNEELEGRLATVTPFREFTLWVTPESTPLVQAPTNDPVMQAQVSAD